MTDRSLFTETLRRISRPLMLTHAGLVAERLARAFWPLWSVLIFTLALLMLGVQDMVPVEVVWGMGAALAVLAIGALLRGAMRFRWPGRDEAIGRLDASLRGRPLQALRDSQTIGAGDFGSEGLWRAHQARMADRARSAKAVEPDLRVSNRDVFGLRFVALTVFMVAALFGSFWRVGTVAGMAPGGGAALAAGPAWEGWIEPPLYTGLPVLYLADLDGTIEVPKGSKATLRLYGEVGALSVDQSVGAAVEDPTAPAQSYEMTQDGTLAITGPGGEAWQVLLSRDAPPRVEITGEAEASIRGEFKLPFRAEDDFGVEGGEAVITLNLDAVDRRYGLTRDPEPRDPIRLVMPLPIAGDRTLFTQELIEDLSQHPWANMPVTITLTATDAAGQSGQSAPFETRLSSRRFFDPLAAALIEQRRDLLWNRDNDRRIVQVMKAISWQPEGLFRSETAYLRMRVLLRRMDTITQYASLTDEQVTDLSQALWDLALLIEDGDLDDARERMQRAQERLSEAMKNGASDEEIARLMQELRDATQDYMRQLSREAAEEGQMGEELSAEQMENAMRLSQDDLQAMMDRIQELMEQGRMAEAHQALEELQRMMENMRVTQGQGGQQQSPGQQAMEGLSETLREQQGLSDQAFRDLQEQFNPNANRGDNAQNEGRDGNQGRGQQHGQGAQGQRQGEGQQEGQGQGNQQSQQQGQGQQQGQPGGGGDGSLEGDLAGRQQALRNELNRQRGNLPGMSGEAGEAAREALERAERSMQGAEDALRDNDLAEAIDQQSDAMEALREGLRNMGEAMAEEQRQRAGQQGQAQGNQGGERNDPLGRQAGTNGEMGSQQDMLQDRDVYRRALELEQELRRRSGDGDRPEVERDYLKRLLERF
ncbi:TIGR02302 family protein [Pseudooceanicola onchidii]|uniref:TIGR02302 family protein n=1 Tax=Pseudooceanicola onchidii TaxID=2562279 RepID=UPI0010A9F618|nr:TIGR02302 family protein [Pseudooceanicola onchidii]